MLIPFVWEEIDVTPTTSTARAKVPGGWLVNILCNGRPNFEMSTTFVADEKHEWDTTK